jgi:acyl-coenzyme A synthetase/AMP-(fatty) acid ligase
VTIHNSSADRPGTLATVPEAVLGRTAERAEVVAMIDGATGREVPYAELQMAVDQLAIGFADAGVAKGDTVCLFTPNHPAYAPVFYAASRIGAVLAPVSAQATVAELVAHLARNNVRLMVTSEGLLPIAAAAERNLGAGLSPLREIFLLHPSESRRSLVDLFGSTAAAPDVTVDAATDTALVTRRVSQGGGVQAVRLTHAEVARALDALDDSLPLAVGERVLAEAPWAETGETELLMHHSLASGATTFVPDGSDPEPLLEAIEQHRVETALLAPSTLAELAAAAPTAGADLSSLRRVVCCGPAPEDSTGRAAALGNATVSYLAALVALPEA